MLLANKVCNVLMFQTHHDSGNADAHVANDVEFVVEEILDATFTILQCNNIWWEQGWGSGRSLMFP